MNRRSFLTRVAGLVGLGAVVGRVTTPNLTAAAPLPTTATEVIARVERAKRTLQESREKLEVCLISEAEFDKLVKAAWMEEARKASERRHYARIVG